MDSQEAGQVLLARRWRATAEAGEAPARVKLLFQRFRRARWA
jgi:hypothetical protein